MESLFLVGVEELVGFHLEFAYITHSRALGMKNLSFVTPVLDTVLAGSNHLLQNIVGLHLAIRPILHISSWLSRRLVCCHILI